MQISKNLFESKQQQKIIKFLYLFNTVKYVEENNPEENEHSKG